MPITMDCQTSWVYECDANHNTKITMSTRGLSLAPSSPLPEVEIFTDYNNDDRASMMEDG